MATINELYQQYLLTQPGIGGSQNRYRELMSQATPFVNPYPASRGLLAAATAPRTPATNPLGTYSGGDGSQGGGDFSNPSWDGLTDVQRAEFYAENPGFSRATQIGQALASQTLFGRAQALADPDKANREGLIAQGFDFNAYQKARDEFRETELQYAKEQEAIEQARAEEVAAVAREAAQAQAANNVAAGLAAALEAEAVAAQTAANATNVPTQEEVQNAVSQSLLANAFGYAAQIQAVQEAAAQQAASNAAAEAAVGSYGGASFAEQQAINDAIAAGNAAAEAAIGSYGGGSFAEQAAMNDAISAAADSSSGYGGGYGTGDSSGFGGGTDSGGDGYAKGGKVTKNRLKGPNPRGPDEGYGALLGGEFVIKKSAVKKYGEGLLSMINDGKIPAKKMKSLLG